MTTEGLDEKFSKPLQMASFPENFPQCDYCKSGQIIEAAILLRDRPNSADANIDVALTGTICRCGTISG